MPSYCELCGNTSVKLTICADCGRRTCPSCLDDGTFDNVCIECASEDYPHSKSIDDIDIDELLDDDAEIDPEDELDDEDPASMDDISAMIHNGGGYIKPTGRA